MPGTRSGTRYGPEEPPATDSVTDTAVTVTEPPPSTAEPLFPIRHDIPPESPSDALLLGPQPPPPKTTVARSTRTDSGSRMANAVKNIARLRLELAEAELAAMRAEATDNESSSDEGPNPATREKVAAWIRHHKQQQAKAAGQTPKTTGSQRRPTPVATAQQVNLNDLAAAIAQATRSSHPSTVPKYIGELTTFNGSHTEWLAFKAAYIETASYFTDVENSARLRRALKGKAKEAVSSLLITSMRPSDVIAELETRFGRPDVIALAEIERLRSIPRATDVPRDFCQFASKVRNCIATLRALNRSHYLYNPEVVKQLTEKLTPSQRYRWFDFAREQPADAPDLLLFYRYVDREADTCGKYADPEPIAACSDEPQPAQQQRSTARGRAHRTNTASDSSERRERTCPVCNQAGHVSALDCDKFKKADSDGRWDMAKQYRLCFRCLLVKNFSHRCKTKHCGEDNCQRTHHRLLHYTPAPEKKETVATSFSRRQPNQSYLKILPVSVTGPDATVNTYALLDDGSTITLIDDDVATSVGAKGPIVPLHLEAIAGATVKQSTSRRVTITLRGQDAEFSINARTMKNLQLSAQAVDARDVLRCPHLTDIAKLVQYQEARPTILLGQDNWELLLAHEVRRGPSDQPVASRTPLGWVLHGSTTRSLGHQVHHVYNISEADDRLEQAVKKHFALESLGVQPRHTRADPDERALKILRTATTELPTGGYSTALLWKTDVIELPNNFESALSRLHCTERKLDKNPELKEAYSTQIEQLFTKGYAEEVKTAPTAGRTWYLPHFPVLHPAKPGKVRPVFDAAARARGTSLNEHLLSGPDFLQSLPGVLMRFRQHPIAVAADVQEMFLRIQIREEDRDALRFLWREHRREGSPREYRMTSVIFGAACSPCTALFVKNHNAEKHRLQYPQAADAIVHHHYMDDYLQSFETVDEALRISHEVRTIHQKANFHLRKWSSNCNEVLQSHHAEETAVRDVTLDHDDEEKILGLTWCPATDTLKFNLSFARVPGDIIDGGRTPTKREALRTVMSLFDPLGLASPVTIQAKQLLQETWRLGTGWDEQLPAPLAEKWSDWLEQLHALRNVSLPRCHPHYSKAVKRELHTFVDASEIAYAAAVYWRTEDVDGHVTVTLAAAKARVSPLKLASIPRLELQAAVLGCRLARTTMEEYQLKPDNRVYWSDSKTVLAWLRAGPRTFKPFVAHRVAEIEEETQATDWRWVPTRHNVADDATRGVPPDFDQAHRWFTGPEFLYESPECWPVEKQEPVGCTGEERVHVARLRNENRLTEALPDVHRFSSWLRLIRATARVLQAVDLFKSPIDARRTATENVQYKRTTRNTEKDPAWRRDKKTKGQTPLHRDTRSVADSFRHLEADHMIKAEQLWIRASQQDAFGADIASLRAGDAVAKDSRLRQLAVCFDDDDTLVKLKTRIAATAQITDAQKSPTVLDGDHPYTRLYIAWVHRTMHHGSTEMVLNEILQRFWVLRARPTTRTVIKRCQPCRLRRATAPIPPTGDHPMSRLAHHQRPFTFTGLDYFGPLSVTVGRQHHKRYVALFTCLTTRAVHLEIAASLSTDSAINALRRMMSRRGCPTEIWSDNGTNLHGADIELQRAALAACREEAVNRSIRWRYISPSAPFMGGAWERLVRSVKTALATTLHERHPHEETLATLLSEAEYTVNSRPLTHVSVDSEDDEALTPNHFLLGGSGRVPIPGTFTETDVASKKHWRQAQRLADLFWGKWLKEYLPTLQYRREPHGSGEALRIGDLVLIADSNLPRNTWPRGRVIRVYPGRDGVVRTADVQSRHGILRRPTKKLVVLPTTSENSEHPVVGRVPEEDAPPS